MLAAIRIITATFGYSTEKLIQLDEIKNLWKMLLLCKLAEYLRTKMPEATPELGEENILSWSFYFLERRMQQGAPTYVW